MRQTVSRQPRPSPRSPSRRRCGCFAAAAGVVVKAAGGSAEPASAAAAAVAGGLVDAGSMASGSAGEESGGTGWDVPAAVVAAVA